MGVTGALAAVIGGAVVGGVQANQAKQYQKGQQAALNRTLAQSIAATPPPPSVIQEQGSAAAAASAAAARQRKAAATAGGYGSTILTSGQGAAPAAVQRKTLLGQ